MLSTDIGIDLGTSNILIYIKKQGIVVNEPSIVAIDKNSKRVLAVGKEAAEMYERTPGKISAIKPLKNGVIADMEITEIMLNELIKKVKLKKQFIKPRILICCLTNITTQEKENIKAVAEATGARKVYIEEEPKVAAIGAGMNIKQPIANMIVDIGGGTTDIAVLSLNDIVCSSSINIAGEKFNEDLIKYIKEKYKLLIGTKTAEKIKIEFANIYNPSSEESYEVKGRDLLTGLPKTIIINQIETERALQESVQTIINEIMKVLESTPPELSADIVEKGIVLTGGGALLTGIIDIIEESIKVPTLIAESPLTCVAEGTGMLLEELKLLEEDQ
ncbi:MAG: rod shape-determining protein [Bacilli bacterium]|nr:rod shape-determining protein [Bacilli bacterium]